MELGVSEGTLRKWVALGAPCVVLNPNAKGCGIRRRYDPAAVRAWLEKWSAEQAAAKTGKEMEA